MTDSICDYVRNRIKEALSNSGKSMRWLAKQCGVDYSIIYRVQSGEQRNLSFSSALKVMEYLEPSEHMSILKDFFPFETAALSKTSSDKAEELLTILAGDTHLYRVFVFAAEKSVTRKDVERKFGEDGLVQLDRLMKLEILSEDFVDTLKGMNYPSEETAKRIAMHSYLLTNLSTPGTLLENFRGAVSLDGIREIYQAGMEYRAKIHQILDSKKGDILVSGSLISGPME